MTILILLIVALIAAVIAVKLIRSGKEKGVSSNRYRAYTNSKSTTKSRVRPNRYYRQTQREPTLGYKHEMDVEEQPVAPVEEKVEYELEAAQTFDPDVVLGLKEEPVASKEPKSPAVRQMTLQAAPLPSPIITFNVIAVDDQPFMGYELLQALLSVGMRYGKHQIFHRHEEKTGRGDLLFSLASVTRPGIFDLPNMGSFSTPGLSLFFQADSVDDPITVYELMLQTAGQLVEDLGGHVLDENRELLTSAKVVAQRRQLREYAECQKAPELFDTVES